MSWRTTAVLLVILLALGGYVIYQNQQEDTAEATPTPGTPPPTVEVVDPVQGTIDDVRGLTVQRHGDGAETLLVRDAAGAWFTTVPTTTAVVTQTLTTKMTGLLNMRTRRSLPADANPLSAYGLDDPAYTITVAVNRAEQDATVPVTLHIGSQTPAGDGYYMQVVRDERVHIVPAGPIDSILELLHEPPEPAATPTAEP